MYVFSDSVLCLGGQCDSATTTCGPYFEKRIDVVAYCMLSDGLLNVFAHSSIKQMLSVSFLDVHSFQTARIVSFSTVQALDSLVTSMAFVKMTAEEHRHAELGIASRLRNITPTPWCRRRICEKCVWRLDAGHNDPAPRSNTKDACRRRRTAVCSQKSSLCPCTT